MLFCTLNIILQQDKGYLMTHKQINLFHCVTHAVMVCSYIYVNIFFMIHQINKVLNTARKQHINPKIYFLYRCLHN